MNQQLLDELLAMAKRDSETRARLLAAGKLYGDYAEEMQRVHKENAKRLDEIVDIYGWPGIALVGLEGCRAAWLVAQHAICTPALQRKFHAVMEQAVESGDVPKRLLACLTDRIRFNENRPQLYGTVLAWNEMGELTCELEDPANVDARRTEVGLPPFEEDLAKHREEVEREGGKAPENYGDHRRKGREWARRVGYGEPGVAPAYGGRTARTNGAYERTKAVFNLHSCADLPKGL